MMAPVLFGFNVLTVSFGRIAQPDIRSYDAKLRNISLTCGAVLGTVYGTLLRLTSPLCDSAMMICKEPLRTQQNARTKTRKTAMPCPRLQKNMYISEEHDESCSENDKSCSDFYSQALQVLTGPEKRTTADQVLSFIVQSCASPRACLTAFLTALLERGIAAGSMRSAARLGAIATGSGKHR